MISALILASGGSGRRRCCSLGGQVSGPLGFLWARVAPWARYVHSALVHTRLVHDRQWGCVRVFVLAHFLAIVLSRIRPGDQWQSCAGLSLRVLSGERVVASVLKQLQAPACPCTTRLLLSRTAIAPLDLGGLADAGVGFGLPPWLS